MKPTLCSRWAKAVLYVCAAAILCAGSAATAQTVVAPTVLSHFSVTPTPVEEARRAAESAARPKPTYRPYQPETLPGGGGSSTPPEIVELARALKNDPDLIYQYVHDNIEFSPLWGYLKGPVGTLLDGRGDSFDQAALMVALLNQASLSNTSISNAGFEFGEIYLNNAQLQSWLGVDSDAYSVAGILAGGGIPCGVTSGCVDSLNDAVVSEVWVKVSISGVPYVFDPAFKSHTWKTGINLATIMGYSQTQFFSDAGATVSSSSIQGVNRTNLRNDLATYTANLANYIRNNMPANAGMSDVIGGGTIVPTPFTPSNGQTVRESANPNQYGAVTNWGNTIPSAYYATLSVLVPGAATQTFNSSDIYGHRLSIFFNTSYVPTLSLDGSAVVSGSASTVGAQVGITLTVSVPGAANSGNNSANQTRTQYIGAQSSQNGGGYLVETGWDQVGRGMIEKHRKLLNQAIQSGAAPNSELALGESLEVLGYTWLAECAAQQRLSDQLLGTTTQYWYGGGIVGQTVGTSITSPYVDLPLNYANTPTRVNGAPTQTANSLAAFLDLSGANSSFESATLEQTQAQVPGFAASSTVKLLDIAMQNGDTIFDINNGNTTASQQAYTNTIRPQLVPNYASGDLSSIDSWVAEGFRVIAPLHGKISIGSWTGVGFKTMQSSSGGSAYGEIISGGLSGGFGGTNVTAQALGLDTVNALTPPTNTLALGNASTYVSPGLTVSGNGTGVVGDPVDHLKGSYQYQHEDLAVGAKGFPYGLSFERSYDSGAQGTAGPLGNGWTHNFAITALPGSDGFTGMGAGTPLSAVSSIAALYVSSNLVSGQAMEGSQNVENFVLEAVVNRWFTDQLTQNVVNVSQGWNVEEFTKLPSGSYAPPLGSASILSSPGGNIQYLTKSGVTMNFNSSGQISSWANAAGATVNFGYSGSNLSSVTSAAGRQLNLNYSGNQISSVSDVSGFRTVSYGYSYGYGTTANLTTFTDALRQNTTFAYDTSGTEDTAGHLTQIYYPSNPGNAFVTNYYDSLGRVKQQADADHNLSQSFFAGSRTEIDDPMFNRHVWYNDPLGNVLSEIQDYGLSPHQNLTTLNIYDAQSHPIQTTMPERDYVSYTYDNLFNPLTVTHTPKPGSPLPPQVQRYTYTTPVFPLPNFEEVFTSQDPNGNVTTNFYNPNGTLMSVMQPMVQKPGWGGQNPQQVFTWTPIGLPQTSQDAEGRVTRYDYNPYFADELAKQTVDYGGYNRLNLVTQYQYDNVGNVISVTDANGNTTNTSFDALRRVTQVMAPISGVVTNYQYYPDGQIQQKVRQIGWNYETTRYSYTPSDKISVATDPLNNTTATTYDMDDRVATVTQQTTVFQNRQRTSSYDALSRLYQVNDTTTGSPGTVLETHSYTPNGHDLSFTDAKGQTISLSYDGLDRLSQTTYPDNSIQINQYDANGNLLQLMNRSGQSISLTYDALNRVAMKNPQGEAAGPVTYGYDWTGRLLQASDMSGGFPYQIGYDTAGRANSYTDQQGHNTQVQYDRVGNRTRLQWPANTYGPSAYYVTYNYDPMNRLTEVDENGSPFSPLVKYQWDALSRLSLITYGDATTDSYSQYDAGDNLWTLAESFSGGQNNVTFNYSWQQNHQLQSTSVNNGAFQYIPSTGTVNYGAANVDNGYTSAGGTNFTYDTNANLTYDGFNTLSYDVENRLIFAQNGTWGGPQYLGIQYLYDPLGHRKQKQTSLSVTTQFVLAGDEEIADFTGTGTGTPQVLTVRGVGGLPVAAVTPGYPETVVYYHHDVLGSSVAATATGQSGAEAFSYGAFGESGAGNVLTYRFGGYRFDTETGLYYVKARYYSPTWGRFLQTDPIGLAGGTNLYAYVGNDPVNGTDPNGTCGVFILNCIGAAVGGISGGISGALAGYHATGTFKGALIGGGAGLLTGAVTGFISPFAVEYFGAAGGAAAALAVVGTNVFSAGAGAVAADVAVTTTIKYADVNLPYDIETGVAVGVLAALPEATAAGLAISSEMQLGVGESSLLSANTATAGIAGAVATTCNSGGCGPTAKGNAK